MLKLQNKFFYMKNKLNLCSAIMQKFNLLDDFLHIEDLTLTLDINF